MLFSDLLPIYDILECIDTFARDDNNSESKNKSNK